MRAQLFGGRSTRRPSRRELLGGTAASILLQGLPAVRADALAPALAALWKPGHNGVPLGLSRDGPFLVARLAREGGTSFRARQRLDAATGTAVCEDTRPMGLFLFSGQSNAGGSPLIEGFAGLTSPFADKPWFPNHVFQTAGSFTSYGDVMPPASAGDDFVPAADQPRTGVFPQTAFMLALEALNRADGSPGPGYAARTDWFGGQPLERFLEGTPQFRNTILSAKALRGAAATYQRQSLPAAIVFIQGETAGEARADAYKAALASHFATLRAAVARAVGSEAPPVLYTQTNQGSTYPAPTGNELAELAAHRADGAPHFLAGPTYQLPLIVEGSPAQPSVIHHAILGKLMLGEMLALAYRAIAMTGRFDPLRPTGAARQGKTIVVTFDVPRDTHLALDGDWVGKAKPAAEGFSLTAAGSILPITAVAIEGRDAVRLTLDRVPEQPLLLSYALDPRAAVVTGAKPGETRFAPAIGTLMAESATASPFAARGFAVPKRIRHYCVRFKLNIA